ncbi:unnamed protein product [Toxocara canis]|uniref:G protein-coupled receptor n=1 Tax=Toxocara canis TaxID=6265 RepID=A0A183UQ60_TOXCA|nr:unnamed protein product [Toxocara canis]
MVNTSKCDAMEIFVKSFFIRVSCILRTVLAILAVVATLMIFKIRGNYMLCHANARMLLHAYLLWNLLLAIAFFVLSVVDVARISAKYADWCDYLISVKIGYPIRAFNVVCAFGIELTMVSFCVERAVAVFFYSKYEKSTSVRLACVLISLQVIGALTSTLASTITITDFDATTVQIVMRTATNFKGIRVRACISFLIPSTTLLNVPPYIITYLCIDVHVT